MSYYNYNYLSRDQTKKPSNKEGEPMSERVCERVDETKLFRHSLGILIGLRHAGFFVTDLQTTQTSQP